MKSVTSLEGFLIVVAIGLAAAGLYVLADRVLIPYVRLKLG